MHSVGRKRHLPHIRWSAVHASRGSPGRRLRDIRHPRRSGDHSCWGACQYPYKQFPFTQAPSADMEFAAALGRADDIADRAAGLVAAALFHASELGHAIGAVVTLTVTITEPLAYAFPLAVSVAVFISYAVAVSQL
jgi:hypothetical protein